MDELSQSQEPVRIRPRDGMHGSSRIESQEIFRELIAEELRRGRLTTSQRKRIVRYAAQMGLSAVEAGDLLAACREEAITADDPMLREHALRLVLPPKRAPLSWTVRILLALNIAVAIHLALRMLG